MKLGAQLYSVRTFLKTPEDLRKTFSVIRDTGYDCVQFSGASTENAELLRDLSQEFGLPIVCTHVSFDRLTKETDQLIREHQTIGCPVIGLGHMPKPYQHSAEGLESFLGQIEGPVRKILDSGLRFAYHNHDFEFEKNADGKTYYDIMLERYPDWQFIADTYWIRFAGFDVIEYLRKIGSERLVNIHFKDMAADEKRSICACGDGTMDFVKIASVCREIGVQNVLVEQDNAADLPDPFEAMRRSYAHLKSIAR